MSDSDRLNETLAMGHANAETIELARRHCRNMIFTEWGGRGLIEADIGLPVNMRRVECLVAQGNASINLDVIASDFYEQHCVGCDHRRPTQQLPNLATRIEARRAEASEAAEAQRLAVERQRRQWEQRVDRRRALAAEADLAMASVLDDIGFLDVEPGVDVDTETTGAALRRLDALAERTPKTFTTEIIDLSIQLVEEVGVAGLLEPLRRLAHVLPEIRSSVLAVACTTLRNVPNVEGGRCVADLLDAANVSMVDHDVLWSLVLLAGGTRHEFLSRIGYEDGTTVDPSGLRVAAELVADDVVAVLREMVPASSWSSSGLVVPPGTESRLRRRAKGDRERAAGAAAIRRLTATHPDLAAQLIEPLIKNLGVDDGDPNNPRPVGEVQHTLATMLVLDIGDVIRRLEAAGRSAGEEARQRLFGVLERVERLLDPQDRFREPGDPTLGERRRHELFEQLLTVCLRRVAGDWGYDLRSSAARLVDELVRLQPDEALSHLGALVGAFLTTVEQLDVQPQPALTAIDNAPPVLQALEAYSHKHSVAVAAQELLSSFEHVATVDVHAVCDTVTNVIADERSTDRGVEVIWRLLPLLGKIGRRHGATPGVLRKILPTLHSYLVDGDQSLRAGALEAWCEIGGSHQLPSSVADLLPALLADNYFIVIRAVLVAARRLDWNDDDRQRLFQHAIRTCATADASEQTKTLMSAMTTVDVLTRDDDRLQLFGQELILSRAADLERYNLRDVLVRDWLPEVQHSPSMAALRLRLARDRHLNDRVNVRDDGQLRDLLECGPGLTALPIDDLIAAALDWAPDLVIGSARFAEVAWRARRPVDAAKIMYAVVEAIPEQPAHRANRVVAQLLAAAADLDAAFAAGDDLDRATDALAAAVDAARTCSEDWPSSFVRQICVLATVHSLLAGRELPAELGLANDTGDAADTREPSAARRERVDFLTAAGTELNTLCEGDTPTQAYLRSFAGLCDVAAHLLRADAAVLDADIERTAAHSTAARRRAELLRVQVLEVFDAADPLAAPLLIALESVKDIGTEDVIATISRWGTLVLPFPIVRGPSAPRGALADTEPDADATNEQDVAVVLASINGQLVTGPEVLRPATAYELSLEVHPGEWPEWADRLEAELLSHFTASEAQTPMFSWQRPPAPTGVEAFRASGTLILRFGLSAGQTAPPFLVNLRWRGSRDGEPVSQVLDVAGHRQLRLRPFDSTRDLMTDYRVVDERLLKLYAGLQQAGYDEDQLQAFCRLFTAICRVGFRMTWDRQYRRGTRVTEKKFHDDLYAGLLEEPELEGRLERGSPLALGFLDVRHDGITAELKVERRTPVSRPTAPKYMGQPTQYAAADGARLSILCVLDLSPKVLPVGTPENYLFTLQPALHGLTNPEAPSLVAVIVVNGNLPKPSDWSRRKTAIQPDLPDS